MTDVLNVKPVPERPGEADYLPETYGAPVAAGPQIETVEARSSRFDDGMFRRPVPTERELEEGAQPVLEDEPLHTVLEPDKATARPSVGRRLREALAAANPMAIPGPKMPLLFMGLGNLVAGWDDQALGLIVPELRAHFGTSLTLLTTVNSVTGFIVIALGMPVGFLFDRVKRVRLIRAGSILGNLSTLLQAVAPTFGFFVGGRMLRGASQVIDGPGIVPLVADYYPSRARARVFAFRAFTTQLGSMLGLPVAGFLIVRFGWRYAVLALATLGLLSALLSLFLREPVRGGIDRLEMGVDRETALKEQPKPSFQEAVRAGWAIRTLRLQAFGSVVATLSLPLVFLVQVVQAERFGLDPAQRAWLGTLQAAATLPALLLSGGVLDRLMAKKPSTVVLIQGSASLLNVMALVWIAFAPSLIWFTVPSMVTAFISATLTPASQMIGTLVVPARIRATAIQLLTPFQLIGLAFGPVLMAFAQHMPPQRGILVFAPFFLAGALVMFASAATVERDIRAARAASLAMFDAEKAAATTDAKLLVCRGVEVAYDGVRILFGIDFDVSPGECVALLGTNGAGKSTLLRAIAGLAPAEEGAIVFDGREITHVPPHENARNGIVYMPGGQAVFPAMTVQENLMTAVYMHGRGDSARQDVDAAVEEVLAAFPVLRERWDVAAGSMSGGEQQMLALGQALLMKPRLLMIDELSLGLAPAVVEQLLEIVRRIRREGTTVLLVEQSLNVAVTIADRAVFMEKGEIRMDGPVEALLNRPDLVRSVFMGGAVAGGSRAKQGRSRDRQPAVGPPLLRASGITVSYGGLTALRDVDMGVSAGEVVGIIGPNGAGKTTLFDVVSGFATADSGTVELGSDDLTSLSPDARARLGLGRAFQNARLFGPLTVRENIAVALERQTVKNPLLAAFRTPSVRKNERKIAARVDGYVELLGLGAHADKFVRELSTGTRRAVEVACIMAAEPKVLLLDEPSSGLAQAETEALGPALLRIVRETGSGLLIIEHDLPLITAISDRLVAMALGTVVTSGSPEEVVHHPAVVESYLAASADVIQRSGARVAAVHQAVGADDRDDRQ